MNIRCYYWVISLLLILTNCSSEEVDPEEVHAEIIPIKIEFVNADGSSIVEGGCIDPNRQYAVAVTVKSQGQGTIVTTEVSYAVNGVSYNMTFDKEGSMIKNVTLIEGKNIAQLTKGDYSDTISIVVQDDFVLVE